MRIVHFLHRIRLEDGGVVRATLDLCAALALRGHDVTLITSDAADVPEAWKQGTPGLPRAEEIPPLTGPLKLLSRWSRRFLETTLSRADLVHIHEFWQPAAAQVAMIAKRLGTPYVVSSHGMLNDWSMAQSALKKQVYMRIVGNRMFKSAGAVHCTAEGEARQAVNWAPIQRTGVVPLVMDMAAYRVLPDRRASRLAMPGDPDVLSAAYMGRLHPQKGVDRLVAAAVALYAAGTPIEVYIAGAGSEDYVSKLKAMARDGGIADRVHFLGHITGANKTRMLRAADLFVLPSFQENFGLVLVESLVCGTPVITTQSVDIWPELVSSGSSVVLNAPDVDSIVDAIRTLGADADRRNEMGAKGRQWALESLNPDRVLEKFEGLYASLMTGQVAPPAPAAERIAATA